FRLGGVLDSDSELAAVAKEAPEGVLIVGRRDDENIADAGEHQGGLRIVDHRLVVDGQQLFADRARQRMQPRSRSACENNAFHAFNPRRSRSYRSAWI